MSNFEYWATFRSKETFDDATDPHPKGFSLAELIRDHLRSVENIGVGRAVENWRDSGYSVDATIDGRSLYLFVSRIDAAYADWALCCTSDLGWIARMRGNSDRKERRMLAESIDALLHSDDRIFDIRWYGPSGWNGHETSDWSNHPIP